MTNWADHWSDKSNGGHRSQTAAFLSLESDEKLFHLKQGGRLLDFGCGSADLLTYYVPHFSEVYGVDFSPGMLAEARKKLEGVKRVKLIQADDQQVWKKIEGSFDCVTAGQVVQYLTLDQLRAFLSTALSRMPLDGRICLFDIIEPRRYLMKRVGLLDEATKGAVIAKVARGLMTRLRRASQGGVGLGFRYRPEDLISLARETGWEARLCWSMYYEYRYHLILSRATTEGPRLTS